MVSESSTILSRIDFSQIFNKIPKGRKIGLQLPDGLKYWADEIASFLERSGYEVVISASPSYGSCDIDLNLLKVADYIVHVAHTPMVRLDNVIFLPYFYDYEVDVDLVKSVVKERRIALAGTVSYAWKFREVAKKLEEAGYEVFLKKGEGVAYEGQVLGCNYTSLRGDYEAVLYIGDGRFHPLGIAFSGRKVYRYSPLSGEIEEVSAEKFLKERYALSLKASKCKKFGVIVSSKIGQFNLRKAEEALRILRENGREAHLILCDEVTPERLGNFKFDCFVNTACPRIAYDDWRKFEKPIITLNELKFALGIEKEIRPDFRL